MIGWDSTYARDAADAIQNGLCDGDLTGLEAVIHQRRLARQLPPCPVCGESLDTGHEHDGILIERVA